jgi:hypothetical protein
MDLAKKLQLKGGSGLRLVNAPEGLELDVDVDDRRTADAILVFARDSTELERFGDAAFEAARADRISWIAYPKAGQPDSDLNRDRLARLAAGRGVRPVRQVAIDDVWSALRFRLGGLPPAKV